MHDLRRTIRHILFGAIAVPYSAAQAAPPSPPPPPPPPLPGQLPVPCQPGTCGANPTFVTSGRASATITGRSLSVNQTSSSATLNWASFNIGADGTVTFVQPSASAVALNRIYDSNPSQIFGNLTANGQIYLINANGFLFGRGANVDVGGLIASSLNITDSTFTNGILEPVVGGAPALEPFTLSYQHFSDDGPPGAARLPNTGTISVAPGAQLTAADGGRLLLAGGSVDNAGTLTAPDGQVILAGGQSVYLQASANNALRGLIVEVDAGSSAAQLLSSVVNEASGEISTPRGNVTLAGLMINQDGRLSATTTVAANGSVTLTAGTAPNVSSGQLNGETKGGQITLGPDSEIEILPELTDTAEAVALQTQLPSTVTLSGQKIFMDGGTIRAPSGALAVTASSDPAVGVTGGDDPAASVRIDAGTTIDLSGSDATLPMDANLIQVQLRSNEFADDPTQRNGALRGDTVTIDIRADGGLGSPIANLSSAIAAVEENIAQRTETGGSATFKSGGDIVFAPGASINVSGGQTTYLGGSVQTTELIGANGQLYNIGSANPLMTYVGVVNPTYTQTFDNWGVKEIIPTPGLSTYEPGYVQGAAAGTVQFVAPSLALQGGLSAAAVSGPYQRTATGAALLGGTLVIGEGSNGSDYLAPPIEVVSVPTPVVVSDGAALPIQTLQLPAGYLTADGFNHIQLDSNATFQLPQGLPLQLPPGTSLQVQAARVDIDSSITSLGGSLIFASVPTVDAADYATLNSPPGALRLGVDIGDGVTLDVSGQWTNDSFAAGGVGSAPTLQNGGTIELQLTQSPAELALGNGVTLRANGGAWQRGTGKPTYGAGGSITLDASPSPGEAIDIGTDAAISAFGVGTASGGSFTIDAPRIALAPGTGSAWTEPQRVDDLASPGGSLQLYAPLLSDYGFSNITLVATGPSVASADTLSVASGLYDLQTQTLQLAASAAAHPSGGTVLGFAQPNLLPAYQRPVANLSLQALRLADDANLNDTNYGAIDVQSGAQIVADPGAAVSITGAGSIYFDGSVLAPSGSFAVKLLSPSEFNFNGDVALDPGYQPDLGITIGPQAVIDVSAQGAVYTPNLQGLLLGTVSNGGTVSLLADRGNLVVAAGSQIDFSGTSAPLDVLNSGTGTYTREVVGTSAGSLQLGSVESIELLGSLKGTAGIGGSGAASGGSLEIDLARFEVIPGQPATSQPLVMELVNDAGAAPAPVPGQATIGLAQILNGTGIDALTLNAGGTAPGEILFSNSEPLALGRSLTLETQTLAVTGLAAVASAPDVEIGSPLVRSTSAAAPPAGLQPGTGSLTVDSQLLTLVGNVTVNQTHEVTLSSSGDIQLEGTYPASQSGPELGSLTVAGELDLLAQRVYPDTYTSFSIQAAAAGSAPSSISIDPAVIGGESRSSSVAPLSAGGVLSVTADRIEVGGSVFAPFGQIDLTANQSLQLSSGALVSVSGAGLDVPYGQTQADGAQWAYRDPVPSSAGLTGNVSIVAGSGASTFLSAVPAKSVSLTAPDLILQPHATVNLTGGGDLYAYEWVPGTGGTQDRLGGSGDPANIPGLFAILPSQPGVPAPHDPQESGTFGSGQTVYLSGGAGVAAGYYALLPPRYALLPGAQLIQIEPSYSSTSGGQIGALGNGVPVVAGFLSSFGANESAGSTLYEGFAIYPSGYAQQLAAYSVSEASTYFATAAAQSGSGPVPLPADAGTLNLNVVASSSSAVASSLTLQGSVQTAAAAGGRGAQVNVSAPSLEISEDGTASAPGAVGLSAAVLQSWDASEITLGGATAAPVSASTAGMPATVAASVAADNVVVDGGVTLSADQIFLVAHDGIEVQGGATLESTSGKSGTVLASAPASEILTLSDPGAAFLAVSDLALPLVSRTGSGGSGALMLDRGSSLASGGALVLDAPASLTSAGTLDGKGAAWSLGSDSIAFVGTSAAQPDTLNIDAGLLTSLETAGSLRLASQSSIDLEVPVTVGLSSAGSPTLGALTLIADVINNESGGSSSLGAASLSLGGASPSPTTPLAGSGTLTLVGNALTLEANPLALSGFANTVVQIAGPVTSTPGSVSGIATAGNLTIDASELTPGAAAQTTLAAGGALQFGRAGSPPAVVGLPLVGGALTLEGSSIDDEGLIAAPAGVVTLTAAAGDVHLGAGSEIEVAGTLLQAADQSAAAPGGTIAINAAGNVTLDSGSMLNVSGEDQAPAGRLSIVAGGTATLAGTLLGHAGSGGSGGDFSVNTGQLAGGFAALASSLTSGGFTDSVDVRVQAGDLALPAAQTLTANSISLTADTGTVDIAGVLSAPEAALRGLIDLSGQSVLLESGAALHADGSGSGGLGGEIEMNATCSGCSITLDPGSTISASGQAGMGEVVLRAAAVPGANAGDVAINLPATGIAGLGANLTRAGQVIIEPVLTFATQGATVASDLPNDVQSASTFLSGATSAITQRLVTPSASNLGATPALIEAGVELIDANPTDTLTLPGIDLSPYSTPVAQGGLGQVINLGVRAAGSVAVNGTISDGFITDPTGNTFLVALSSAPSASFSIVAGADVTSANPLTTLTGSTASLTLSSSSIPHDDTNDGVGPSVVRTGTGDINLAAAGDIVFAAGAGGSGSVYTGGLAPANVLGPYPYYNTSINMNFGSQGGNVRLVAGGDVVGAPVGVGDPGSDRGNFSVTGWLFYQGSSDQPAQYGVDYGAFDWNLGSFGGGDARITAGGSITNLSAAVADSYVSAGNTLNGQATLYGGGGGLLMHAGGDIGSPQIYVADGTGELTADGALAASRTYQQNPNSKPVPVGGTIALGDSQVSVWVRDGLQVNAIYDPTLVPQIASDFALYISNGFLTYGPDSRVSLSTTTGDAILDVLPSAANDPLSALVGYAGTTSGFAIMPPSLNVQSLQGNVNMTGSGQGVLTPAAEGQLTIFAAVDVNVTGNTSLMMADTPLSSVPTVNDPGLALALVPFSGVVHAGDPDPALITAGQDIVGLSLEMPKATQIVAGRDIDNLNFQGQNVSPDDITLVAAGRDYLNAGTGGGSLAVGGPGSLDVLTGRNLNLGFGGGIVTIGDLRNANLTTPLGANVNLLVGYGSQGADVSGFLDSIVAPSSAYQTQLISYVESLNGATGLSFAQAQADFAGFSAAQQTALVDAVFFNELLLSGRSANSGSGAGFAQGYAAIDALFPKSRSTGSPYSGNLTLSSSQIYTDDGGDISILVPGGEIDVGLANTPPGVPSKPASSLGIVAEGSGDIDIYSLGDVNVNTSRIFTLGGGNILIWSTLGSIDAGNGSKSSLSVPPPSISISSTGQVTLNFGSSLAAGSGIRTIQTSDSVPPGNVDLDAPVGTVNAGDAGIAASGNINIAAAHVIGASNISFGGTAAGVPADVSSLGASLSGASSAAAGTTTSSTGAAEEGGPAKQVAPIAGAALSWLDVFVTGLGEENCKPDDIECLKRQKTAVP